MARHLTRIPVALLLAFILVPADAPGQLIPFTTSVGVSHARSGQTYGVTPGVVAESSRTLFWMNSRLPLVGIFMMDRINNDFWWMDYHMFGLGMGRERPQGDAARKLMRIRWEPGLQAVRRFDGTVRYVHGIAGAVLETTGEGAMHASTLKPMAFARVEAHTRRYTGGVTAGTDDFIQVAVHRVIGRSPFQVGLVFEQTGRAYRDSRTLDRSLGIYLGTTGR